MTSPTPKGRPPEYRPIYAKLAFRFALAGLKDEEVAEQLEISYPVFKRWKRNHTIFRSAIKRGRMRATTKVVSALLRNAVGWDEVVKEDRILPNGMVVSVTNTKRHGGNVTAQIFWLKNRMRKHWYDEAPRQPAEATDVKDQVKAVRDGVKAIEQLEALDDDGDAAGPDDAA